MRGRTLLLGACILFASAATTHASEASQAGEFSYKVEADGAVVVSRLSAQPQRFIPRFLVLRCDHDPKWAMRPEQVGEVNYNVVTWMAQPGKEDGSFAKIDTNVVAGDGHDARILKGDTQGRTANYFSTASVSEWVASSAELKDDAVEWKFPPSELGELTARVELSKEGPPALTFHFVAKQPGTYSIGYAGAPAAESSDVSEIWQPLVWQGKRFPQKSYLTLSYRSPLPAPMVCRDDTTVSLVASPEELPFEPLPVMGNSRFGIAIRNEQGLAQPLIFAPVIGGPGSKMEPGDDCSFRMLLWVGKGGALANFEDIARSIYDFRDYRTNDLGSLNETLDNMIAYGMSDFSHFNEELRGCSYATDVPGAVKNVSSLHPLSAALVTDNPEIYERRVRPTIEYLLSREKFLFATSPDIKVQNPSWRLRGPCAPTSELAALHSVTANANPYLQDLAKETLSTDRTLNLSTPIPARRWDDVMAVAVAGRDDALMQEAIRSATRYVNEEIVTTAEDFNNLDASFWDELVPRYPELLTLFENTGDARWLEAARQGARAYCQFIWMTPKIPNESILVNKGGLAPHYYYRARLPQMKVPAEEVEAWRLSEIGLAPEGPPTSWGHRGVFLATHAPWMMRIGALTNDDFLKDVARSAVVGRYLNFPGYHMNTGRTTVYEKADYPLRGHDELSYNSFHYNHIWPHIALLIDYLASDVFAKSEGQISFPSQFAEGYAYLKTKAYGDRPGRFYDDAEAWLWMPKGLVDIDNRQLNYLTARNGDTLYVTLANQSPRAERAVVRFAPELAKIPASAKVRAWTNNVAQEGVKPVDGAFTIEVPPGGLVALAIDGAEMPERLLKPPMQSPESSKDGKRFARIPFAEQTTGLLLTFGDRRGAYVYLEATYETVARATLHYAIVDPQSGAGEWQQVADNSYPYEFTVPLPNARAGLKWFVETETPDGKVERSPEVTLGIAE